MPLINGLNKQSKPPRKSSRAKKTVLTDYTIGISSATLFEKGYLKFLTRTVEKNQGDGSQNTTVTLYVNNPRNSCKYIVFKGVTGKSGHAEMHALIQAIERFGDDLCGRSMFLSCTSKPCCVRCSATLGLAEVAPYPPVSGYLSSL